MLHLYILMFRNATYIYLLMFRNATYILIEMLHILMESMKFRNATFIVHIDSFLSHFECALQKIFITIRPSVMT